MPRPKPQIQILRAMQRMSGAAYAADIACEAGIERSEAVQVLIQLRAKGAVLNIGEYRYRWLKIGGLE